MEGLKIAVIILAIATLVLWVVQSMGTVVPQILSVGVPILFAVLALVYFFNKDKKK